MEQPKNMSELLRSVMSVAQDATTQKVVGTIATRSMSDLASSNRVIAQQMLAQAQANAMAVAAAAPGAMVQVRQTDDFYRSNDPSGHARKLIAHVEFLGVRSR